MEFNISDFENILEMEEITGFQEFLKSLNFTTSTNETNTSSIFGTNTIVTIALSIAAFILNILAICGTYHIPNGLTTHSKLIISLSGSDILIVISVLAHELSKILHKPLNLFTATADERLSLACSFAFVSSLNIMAHLISLLNLLMMAVDHFLAILKPYQYSFLLNKRNGVIIIIIMWCVALVGGFCNFLTGIGSYTDSGKMNYCEYIMYNDYQGDYLVIGCTFLSLFSIIFIYLRIYYEVRKMNKRLSLLTVNRDHNAKTLLTTLLIIGTFVLCWLPLFLFQTVLMIQIHYDAEAVVKTIRALLIANKYLYSLLLMNSICDPIIYAIRLKEVQLGYKKFWKSICICMTFLPTGERRKSSILVTLLNKPKKLLENENERTVSTVLSENVSEKENEKFISENDEETV